MRISVIMSVYNEPLNFIDEAIISVLNQTYTNFNFIIVNDNPMRLELDDYLKCWLKRDNRIHIIKNKMNLGLALSMNKAASYLDSDYLIRMDADDICYPSRFDTIISVIVENNYDLVCSSFEYIDENGLCIGKSKKQYSDEQIKAFMKYDNIIHHPTTIFKTSIFNEVGQYNDLPCAQDYDLWYRFISYNAKVHMDENVLLQYRIQPNSTTSNKRFMQSVVMDYIQKINKENSSFDKEKFNLYYQQNKQKYEKKFQLYNEKYEYFLKYKKRIMSFFCSLIFSPYNRKKFINLIKYKIYQKSNKI